MLKAASGRSCPLTGTTRPRVHGAGPALGGLVSGQQPGDPVQVRTRDPWAPISLIPAALAKAPGTAPSWTPLFPSAHPASRASRHHAPPSGPLWQSQDAPSARGVRWDTQAVPSGAGSPTTSLLRLPGPRSAKLSYDGHVRRRESQGQDGTGITVSP